MYAALAKRLLEIWTPSMREEAVLSDRNRLRPSAATEAIRGLASPRRASAFAASAIAVTASPPKVKSRFAMRSGMKTSYGPPRLPHAGALGSAGQKRLSW
jgi:hypothetical protein